MKTLAEYFIDCKSSTLGESYFVLAAPEIVNTKNKFSLLCAVCNKTVDASPGKIFGGQKPCACGKNYYKTPERRSERLQEELDARGVVLLGPDKINSSHQNVDLECLTCGVVWSPTYASFVNGKKGCPKCAGQWRYSDEEYIKRVEEIGQINKFQFVSKVSEDKLRIHSFVRLRCHICTGEWEASLGNTLTGKYSCPNCARRGFNPVKRAILYLLKVKDSEQNIITLKYGITNVLDKRLRNLEISNSDKTFEIIATWGYEDGKVCRSHENLIKSKFNPHLSKEILMDGHTETIDPEYMMEFFYFQNSNYSTGVTPGSGTSGGPTN